MTIEQIIGLVLALFLMCLGVLGSVLPVSSTSPAPSLAASALRRATNSPGG